MGDRVFVEATYDAYIPYKWSAQCVQTLPTPNQGLMKPTQSTGGGTLHQQNQSQSSDPDNSCEGQLLTVYESCGSNAKAEGDDESRASCCCNGDGTAAVESGSPEMFFDDCAIGSDTLEAVKENDIEVAKVLGEETDLPELSTYKKANL